MSIYNITWIAQSVEDSTMAREVLGFTSVLSCISSHGLRIKVWLVALKYLTGSYYRERYMHGMPHMQGHW